MNPLYFAVISITAFLVLALLHEDTDDDNDGPGGGILQPAYASNPS